MKRDIDFSKYTKEQLIEFCQQILREKDEIEAKFYEMEKELNKAVAEKEKYLEQLTLARHREFGKKSEANIENKVKDNKENLGAESKEGEQVFNEAEKEGNEEEKVIVKEKKVRKKSKGRTKNTKNFDEEYLKSHVSKTIYLEPDEIEELRKKKNVVELEANVFYKATVVPSKIEVVKIVCKKYFDRDKKKFYQAVKDDVFPHSICTPELATDIMIKKFMYGLPYYRQSEVMINDGLKISRQNLCNYQLRSTEILRPMYNQLKKYLLNTASKVIYADETTLNVLESDKSKCYCWVYATGFYDHPIYIYDFRETRSRKHIEDFLNKYQGYLVTDKYGGYANLNGIENSYCWVHARRKFVEILKTIKPAYYEESTAYKIVKLIDELFRREAKFKKLKYGPQTIKDKRNKEEYLEVLNKIFETLHNVSPADSTSLKEAINYILKDEESFKTFLKDGHIEISNNISERAIKPFVIDRKNFLFSNTINGAESSLIFFSLQQTARANNVDPSKYICDLLKVLYKDTSEETLDKYLPWNYNETISKK